MSKRMFLDALIALCLISTHANSVSAQAISTTDDAIRSRSAIDVELDGEVARAGELNVTGPEVNVRDIAALVQTARKCERHDRREDATDVYNRAAMACRSLIDREPGAMKVEQSAAIFITAASALNNDGRHAEAMKWLASAEQQPNEELSLKRIGEAYLSTAAGLLDQNDLAAARDAYSRCIEVATQFEPTNTQSIATARLGFAWTLVMLATAGNDPDAIEQALDATDSFLKQHPDHADASSALLLKLSCSTRLQDTTAVASTQDEILKKFPESAAACEVLKSVCRWQNDLPSIGPVVRDHLVAHQGFVIDSPTVGTHIDTLACGLLVAAAEGHIDSENAYAIALSINDETGDASTYVLEHLHTAGHDAAASRIAIGWMTARDAETINQSLAKMQSQSGRLITTGTREAACRWAGRTGHWSMLAMAAEDEAGLFHAADDEVATEEAIRRGRSPHVERLFAEALLQTGDSKASLKLWEHIVDRGKVRDFPTLLRTAETAVAAGSVAQATKRIAAAQAAAQQTPEIALTDLLSANLEIRQLRFDRGRALLERVVRSSETEADLRGRAQWMIGETFFMQQKFADAIAAYRQVEPISRSDEWTAAALVQAGKSFEQLGRTREATVCYSTLVSRFGESRHATGARRRLAAMTNNDPQSQPLRR